MGSHHGWLNQSSSISLKTICTVSPTCSRAALEPPPSGCKVTTPRLGRTVGRHGSVKEQRRDPFFARALLSNVSAILLLRYPSVRQALLPQPTSTSPPATCRGSMTAIGFLVVSCSQPLFPEVMDTLLAGAATNASMSPKSSQCTGSTSRQAGHRVAHHLGLDMGSVRQTSLSFASRHLPLLTAEKVRSEASKDATVVGQPSSSSLEGKCVQLARSLETPGATTVRLVAKGGGCFVDAAKLEAKLEAYVAIALRLLSQNALLLCITPADQRHLSCLENVAGGLSAVHSILTSRLQWSAWDTMPLTVEYFWWERASCATRAKRLLEAASRVLREAKSLTFLRVDHARNWLRRR